MKIQIVSLIALSITINISCETSYNKLSINPFKASTLKTFFISFKPTEKNNKNNIENIGIFKINIKKPKHFEIFDKNLKKLKRVEPLKIGESRTFKTPSPSNKTPSPFYQTNQFLNDQISSNKFSNTDFSNTDFSNTEVSNIKELNRSIIDDMKK